VVGSLADGYFEVTQFLVQVDFLVGVAQVGCHGVGEDDILALVVFLSFTVAHVKGVALQTLQP